MPVNILSNPIDIFLDSNGAPLQGGSIYIGQPNTDPTNPANWITVYQNQGLSIPLQQPIKTTNGQPSLNGSQIPVYLGAGVTTYSLAVLNAGGVVVMSLPSISPFSLGGSATGSMVFKEFVAGTDFTAGTAPVLTLTSSFGSAANVRVDVDGVLQKPNVDYTVSGTTLTFISVVPAGTQTINTVGGVTLPVGTPGAGSVIDASIAAGTKLANRSAMWFDVKDPAYGATGTGTTDDTVAIQAAINAATAVGGIVFFSPGTYLCGALTVNTAKGGAIYAVPRTASLIPNGNGVTFFTLNNSLNQVPYTIDGLEFNNNALKTGCNGVAGTNLYQFALKNIVVIQMAYIATLTSSAPATQAFNASIENVIQYGSGSFSFVGTGSGTGAARYYDVHMNNITQFTTGGDTWAAPWITAQRVITLVMNNVHGQSLSGNAIGLHIVGQCEGIFLNNVVIPFSASGIVADVSNGDTVLPSWIYLNNVGVDQFTTHGLDMSCNYLRISNANITGGATRLNTGSGLLIRGTCIDYTVEGLQIQGMYHDGLTVLSGATNGRFIGCSFNGNGVSGSGTDVDIVATTPLDPMFSECQSVTRNLNGSAVINGGSTSRYVNSQRLAVNSNGTSNQVLATYTLPANSFVDGKTIRISASGIFAANANSKTVLVQIGGVTVATVTGTFNGTAWKVEGECFRVDVNNVWMVGTTFAGSASNVTSVVQNPFNSAVAFAVQLLVTTSVASDIQMHHFDVELIN